MWSSGSETVGVSDEERSDDDNGRFESSVTIVWKVSVEVVLQLRDAWLTYPYCHGVTEVSGASACQDEWSAGGDPW